MRQVFFIKVANLYPKSLQIIYENLSATQVQTSSHLITTIFFTKHFLEHQFFANHFLRDGFFDGELDFATHEGYFDANREGWFLHLHGSPLFVTREGEPKKITRDKLADYAGENSFHVVLTNADSKPSVIESSSILTQYWQKLDELLRDAEKITLFGYGGEDKHLNRLVGLNNTAHIRVVCRSGDRTEEELDENGGIC